MQLSPNRITNTVFVRHTPRTTTSVLLNLSTTILSGLNQPKPATRTLVAALDLQKAYYALDIRTLIDELIDSNMPPRFASWLGAYIYEENKLAPAQETQLQYPYRTAAGICDISCIVQWIHR